MYDNFSKANGRIKLAVDSLMAFDKLEHQSVDYQAAMSDALRDQYYAGWKKAVQKIL